MLNKQTNKQTKNITKPVKTAVNRIKEMSLVSSELLLSLNILSILLFLSFVHALTSSMLPMKQWFCVLSFVNFFMDGVKELSCFTNGFRSENICPIKSKVFAV